MAEKKREPDRTVSNKASDNATVGVQAGVVHGDVRYEVRGEDPAEKWRVAKNCIAGDMPRRAEELIKKIVEEGFVSRGSADSSANEVAYYWAIAVLSDRTIDLLGKNEIKDLEHARRLAARGPDDEWHRAHDVLIKLVDRLLDQEESGRYDPQGLETFFRDFDRLREDRRDEIRRHLDLILTGALQDRMDAAFAETARRRRMGERREERVWKFFEPVPEEPRPKKLREPALGPMPKIMAVCGTIAVAGGLVLAMSLVALQSGRMALLAAALIAGASTLLAWCGPTYYPARYSVSYPPLPPAKPTAFGRYVARTIRREFEKQAPKVGTQSSPWSLATQRLRNRLAHEITDLYGDLKADARGVDWLIAWYAKEAARRWSAHEPVERRPVLPETTVAVAAAVFGAGWLTALIAMVKVHTGLTTVAFLFLVAGGLLLSAGRVDVYVVGRFTYARERAAADRRLAEEKRAYEERHAELADRPGDADMVRWLDYDKIYLKTLAMNQYGLSNRDVIAHAILTGAAPNSKRARFRNGPPRFSSYTVWVFLLTAFGVRQIAVNLHFPTGLVSDQERMAFRYDAIASARVTEVGFRFDDGVRVVIFPNNDGPKKELDTSALILYQQFRLSLTNGKDINITVESFEEWLERLTGDPDAVPAPLPDRSDLSGALRILEAVAADGRDWITEARARHRRRASNVGTEFLS